VNARQCWPRYVNQFSLESEFSLCKIAWQTVMSYWSTRNLLKNSWLHLYHIQVTQIFEIFAVKALNFLVGLSSLLITVQWRLFNSVVCFHMNCYVNKRNSRIWSNMLIYHDNFHETPLLLQKIVIMCADSPVR